MFLPVSVHAKWVHNSNRGIHYQDTMENIFNCKKTETGVGLVWMEGDLEKKEFFSFPQLLEMRIKVPDLVENPHLYRIDLQEHKIYQSQAGRSPN
jgi:hypothetical protein